MSIDEKYLNFLRNKLCVDEALTIAFKVVAQWGSTSKISTETWLDFIKRKSMPIDKSWLKQNTDNGKLKETDLDKFDVTFLKIFLC